MALVSFQQVLEILVQQGLEALVSFQQVLEILVQQGLEAFPEILYSLRPISIKAAVLLRALLILSRYSNPSSVCV